MSNLEMPSLSRRRVAATVLVMAAAIFAAAFAVRPSSRPAPAPPLERPSGRLRVPILVYHSVAPHHPGQTREQRELDVATAVFQAQMQYLVDHGYHVIPLSTLVDALTGSDTVPANAVVLTFDDGWANQYRDAYPVLRRFGMPATFFVYSDPIGVDPGFMTWDQLREMQAAGMTIGSHSRTHPELTSAHVALADEIAGSRDAITQHLGSVPDFFAYPYGVWDQRVANAVRAAGYRAARAYPGGAWNTAADRYALNSVLTTDDMTTFAHALAGP